MTGQNTLLALRKIETNYGTGRAQALENAYVNIARAIAMGSEKGLFQAIAELEGAYSGIVPTKVKGTDIVSLPGYVTFGYGGTGSTLDWPKPGPGPDWPVTMSAGSAQQTGTDRKTRILSAIRAVGADPEKMTAEQTVIILEKTGALPEKVKGTDIVSLIKDMGLDPKKVKGTDIVGFLDGMGSL